MRGNEILLTTPPKGVFEECVISGTPKPGTVMEMVAGVAPVGGRFKYQASSQAAGTHRGICVLMPDRLQGKPSTDAYADGDHGFLYWPAPGEELNMLVGDVAGTGDTIAIGDYYGVNNNGKLIKDSTYNTRPFRTMEAAAALTADTLIWTKFLGAYA